MVSLVRNNKTHIYFVIGIVCSLALALALYLYQGQHAQTLIQKAKIKLADITQQRIEKIETYINQKQSNLTQFAAHATIYKGFQDTTSLTQEPFKLLIQSYSDTHHLQNILLIRPDGSVVYAHKQPELFKVNLLALPYDTTNLGQAFQQTSLSLTPTFSLLSYDFFLKTPSLYLIVPVFQNNILLGFVAAQLDHNDLYNIAQEYFDLGATGEVYFTSLVQNTVQIISPTRHNPEAAFESSDYILDQPNTFREKSILGKRESAIGIDYRSVLGVGSWGYIAILGWGVVVKMDLNEVLYVTHMLYYLSMALFLFSLLLTIVSVYVWRDDIKQYAASLSYYSMMHHIPVRAIMSIILVICMVLIGLLGYLSYQRLSQNAVRQTQNLAETKLDDVYWAITNDINKAMIRTQSIADDLSIGRLKKEDLLIRMNRELQENPSLFGITVAYGPYAYEPSRKLFAPHVTQHNKQIKTEYLEQLYDYTTLETQTQGENDWYHKSLAAKSTWFNPVKETQHNKTVAWYGVPFYAVEDRDKTTPLGVVMIEYDLAPITLAAQKLIIGDTGYAFITTQNGTFLYHPNTTFVENKKTIADLARIYVSEDLKSIGKKIEESNSGMFSFVDPEHERLWLTFKTIPRIDWKLGVMFSEKEITLSADTARHLTIWIIIAIVMLLSMLAYVIAWPTLDNISSLKKCATLLSIIFLGALMVLLSIIWDARIVVEDRNDIIIKNETNLRAFLVDKEQRTKNRYETLTLIPTGIVLNSLSFPDTEHAKFTGSIWQKYDAQDTITPRGLRFPEGTEVSMTKEFEQTKDNVQTIGWKVTATLRQYYDYTKYPLDQRTVTIPLSPIISTNKNILCVPAFADYRMQQENSHIGISKHLYLSEFNIKQTYFDFNTEHKLSTLGIEGRYSEPQEITLQYNILLKRSLINAFVVYVVPILVILFSLYAIFIKTIGVSLSPLEIVSSLIAPYTGLLFALIVLHGALRSNYRSGGFLFIEALFSLTYITLLIFILHALFVEKKPDQRVSTTTILLELFFWPVQFAFWFITTVIVFYN